MSATKFKKDFLDAMTKRMIEITQQRGNLSRDDLGYLMERVSKLKDERMKECIAELIGWGDEERAELETFLAIALEIMASVRPSTMRDAVRKVEIRYHIKNLEGEGK